MSDPTDPEAELERFRRQWQQEVYARRGPHGGSEVSARTPSFSGPQSAGSVRSKAPISTHVAKDDSYGQPRTFDDLPNKEDALRLGTADQGVSRDVSKPEPQTALEHYELAVENESAGKLGDSLRLYRTAFKMDDKVDVKYKNKHFPPSAFKPKPAAGPTAGSVPAGKGSVQALPPTLSQMIHDFASLSIPGTPAPTDASPAPPCPISQLPSELISQILHCVAVTDVSRFVRAALVCKRFAYHVLTEERTWRAVVLSAEQGFGSMHYRWSCDVFGAPLLHPTIDTTSTLDDEQALPPLTGHSSLVAAVEPSFGDITQQLLRSTYASSWRTMYRLRPRIRFHGVYISTVNYTRPGGASVTINTWSTPVHVVTYYRYLRFYRDGTVLSLLTTAEPIDVVHVLARENLADGPGRGEAGSKRHHHGHNQDHGHLGKVANSRAPATGLDKSGSVHAAAGSSSSAAANKTDVVPALPSSVIMRDVLRGRWRLSGPGDGTAIGSSGSKTAGGGPTSTATVTATGHDSAAVNPTPGHPSLDEVQDEVEVEGDVHIETEGVVPKYIYKLQLGVGTASGAPPAGQAAGGGAAAGKRASRNNRLVWKGFWSYNRLTDDWAEFGLKNDRAFWFSRVKSYGNGG